MFYYRAPALMALCLSVGCASAPIAGSVVGEDNKPVHHVFVRVVEDSTCLSGTSKACSEGNAGNLCEDVSSESGEFQCSFLESKDGAKVRLKPELTYEVRLEKAGHKTHCYCLTYDRKVEAQRTQLPYRSSSQSPRSWPEGEMSPPIPDVPTITTQGG